MQISKSYLNIDVYTAAKERISWVFDTFPKICVSFSGGKDSTIMLHLMGEEARKRNRKIGCLFIDWEAQYALTIDHITNMLNLYKDVLEIYWVALPLKTVNAVSQYEPEWICWEKGKEDLWVRSPSEGSIIDYDYFPFYSYAMTFEEFVPKFCQWYGNRDLTAIAVGIRTDESLNRFVSIISTANNTIQNKPYINGVGNNTYNFYPLYDWKVSDIWKYHGITGKIYNKLYDRMYQAGVPLHNMRICEPYGSEQRTGLWLFHAIEPDTWSKVVSRVSGANMGAIYSKERGNILGRKMIDLPEGHTWESFAMQILSAMPTKTSEHYKTKIAKYIHWYLTRDYPQGIPDEQEGDVAYADKKPSWRRICKTLLKNDYWCKTLSFAPTKTSTYERYMEHMKQVREEWKIL